MPGRGPGRLSHLHGKIVTSPEGEMWFYDKTGGIPLRLYGRGLTAAEDIEITAFPVRTGSKVALEGPVEGPRKVSGKQQVLEHAADIHLLSPRESASGIPVRLRAVATYLKFPSHLLFVQEGDTGMFVLFA